MDDGSKGGLGQEIVHGLALVCATGLFSGYFPWGPGTAGAVVALPLCALIAGLGPVMGAILALVVTALAVISAHLVAKRMGVKDPSIVTADEIAGMSFAFVGHRFDWASAIGLFLLFRLFDISKPFPVKQLERMPGGLGIVMDDVAAGILANLVWRAVILLAPFLGLSG